MANTREKIIEHLEALDMTVVYTVGDNLLHVTFHATEIMAREWTENNVPQPYGYSEDGVSMPSTTNPERGERYVSGSVKWDGCINYSVGIDHACEPDELGKLSATLIVIYHRCGEILKHLGTADTNAFTI